MATFFNPIVYKVDTSGNRWHDMLDYTGEEKIDIQAIDVPGLISTDADNVIKAGTDGKLFSLGGGTVECKFNIEDLISAESGNMSRPSLVDGLLYTDSCVFNSADFVSTDVDNSIKFGGDGLLYVYGGDECQVNISELISADADNAITLSINDGKLFATSSATCTYNVIDFISTNPGNEITVGADGKLMVENLVCTWPIVDMISNIPNNRIKSHVTGDGKLYVIPSDLVSTTAPNALSTDASDFLLRVNPKDIISDDANSGLSTGTDGKLILTGGDFWLKLFAAGNFMKYYGPTLPPGGTWAYISFAYYEDGDLPGDSYLQNMNSAGIGAGGSLIPGGATQWFEGSPMFARNVVWRVA